MEAEVGCMLPGGDKTTSWLFTMSLPLTVSALPSRYIKAEQLKYGMLRYVLMKLEK